MEEKNYITWLFRNKVNKNPYLSIVLLQSTPAPMERKILSDFIGFVVSM